MQMKLKVLLAALFILSGNALFGQDSFENKNRWYYDSTRVFFQDGLVTMPSNAKGTMMVLNDAYFEKAEIEFDFKGKDEMQESFLGLAFNIQSATIFEWLYFRPFNFENEERKTHSVQYVFEPVYTWKVLRENFPDKFENEIVPAPKAESWVHAKIILTPSNVKVFVNNSDEPSLVVDRLSLVKNGNIGFFASGKSPAEFKNLKIKKEL